MSEPFVTIFHDKYGHRIDAARPMGLLELERVIRAAPAATEKEKLPLLKLARFGDLQTKKSGFRHDQNVLAVFGIEGDYDSGEVSMSQAAEALSAVGLAALLYTSANHTPDFHKWRVLVALSTPLEGTMEQLKAQRRHWCGVLNAILGGILETESFVLSQSYFFGPIKGKPVPEILRLSGVCLDQLEDMPKPVFSAKAKAANGAGETHDGGARDPTPDADLLEAFKRGRDRTKAMLKLSSRWVTRGMSVDDIEANLLALLGADYLNHARVDLRTRARTIAETACKKYGDPREKQRDNTVKSKEQQEAPVEKAYVLLPFEHFLAAVDPPEFIVDGLLETQSVIGVVAPPESGKSLLAQEIGVCVALGREFHGRKVKRGLVVYLVGEGQHGLRARFQALEQRYGISSMGAIPLVVSKVATSLLDPMELNRVRDAIRAAIDRYKLPLVLLIVDTLARFIAPGDESLAKDMGAYFFAIDVLREDAAAVSLHHPGHADSTRGRGSSSWKGALDAEFSLANSAGTVTVTCQKMKDSEKPAPFSFRIETAPTRMARQDGSPVQSVILVPTDSQPVRKQTSGKNQKLLLAELERHANADSVGVWTEGELRKIARDLGMHRNSARDAVLGLRQLGYLVQTIGGSRLSDGAHQ